MSMRRDDASILMAVALIAALAMGLGNEWANAVGLRLSREGTLVLPRAHPRFRTAVLGGNRDRLPY